MSVVMKSQTTLKMGHEQLQGQMLEKRYVCSRGHIFSLIIMKFDQHVCLDDILHKFENGSCWIKN